MFSNLTKEILYYSLIPVSILFIIVLLLFLISKKSNGFQCNYSIKVLLLLIIGLVLPLIIGYTIWVIERFNNINILSEKIIYIILLSIMIISLIALLITTCVKLVKSLNMQDVYEYELENEKEF